MAEYDVVRLPVLDMQGIDCAFRGFKNKHGRLPRAVVVNPARVERMERALLDLDYDIPVWGTGGALMLEMWLQTNDTRKEAVDA